LIDSIPRHLILSSDEETWKFDQPILFLGEWCRRYDRKVVWNHIDGIVACPYGVLKNEKDHDNVCIKAIENDLIPRICEVLNAFHQTQYDDKFWRIVLGHWLRRYITVLLNRYRTVEQCLELYNVKGVTTYKLFSKLNIPKDSMHAISLFNDSEWNSKIFANILKSFQIPIDVIESASLQSQDTHEKSECQNSLSNLTLKRVLHLFTKMFVRKNDAFIIKTYLPKIKQIQLELFDLQVPQFWEKEIINIDSNIDLKLRNRLYKKISSTSKPHITNSLDHFVVKYLFQCLPICYLEGFHQLENKLSYLPWPKSPKYIYTCNSFDTDEIFKLWAAKQVSEGTKYIIGQHGNAPLVYRTVRTTVDKQTADKYITWGYDLEKSNYIAAYVFKTNGRKEGKYNLNGNILLIQKAEPDRLTSFDDSHQYVNYLNDQFKLINNLEDLPKKKLLIRPPMNKKGTVYALNEKWKEIDPNLKISSAVVRIEDLIADSCLVIHSYDSTGILETLSQNIPTLAFWQNGIDHLTDDAIQFYKALENAQIIHFSPESLAKKVNYVSKNIQNWWVQKDVQDARIYFCDRYAKNSLHPIRELSEILNTK
jgi:putative transferase (TIGR04331 family)